MGLVVEISRLSCFVWLRVEEGWRIGLGLLVLGLDGAWVMELAASSRG